MRRVRRVAALCAMLAMAWPGRTAAPPASPAPSAPQSLRGICPAQIVLQLDWLPQAEHGGLFQLIGRGGTMRQGRYEGPLGNTGIRLVLLAGGKGIGLGDGETALSSLYMGNSRAGLRPDLALVDLDSAITFSSRFPAVGIFAPLDKSPVGLFWDRATYPRGFHSVADLKRFAASGRGQIYISTTRRTFGRYLVDQGIPRTAFAEGYSGDAENFVLHRGRWLNQGSVTSEGYQFAHGRHWEKPVDFLLLSDMGYPIYPGMVSVAAGRMRELAPCLARIVPMMQRAQADYARDPARANDAINRFNEAKLGAPFWHTAPDLLAAAVVTMKARGIVSNGANATIGDFDTARGNMVLGRMRPTLDIRAKKGVLPQDVMTNRFIDPAIGLR